MTHTTAKIVKLETFDMKGEWCYFKGHFSPDICNHILAQGLSIPAETPSMGVANSIINSEFRRGSVRFIQQDNENFKFLFDELWKLALQANDVWFDFHLSKLSYLQLAEYDEAVQGEYKRHQDVFWINNDPKYHRKLSCIIQLTDPDTYEGGNFELYETTMEQMVPQEIRTQGTVIFIPSFIYHAATPVTKGTRHSVAAWFDGPKWR